MNFSKCSLGLNTRIKDKRNFLAQYSHALDKNNTQYILIDKNKKCEIFGIKEDNIDFITKKKMTGCGEHFYPLSQEFKKKKRIGSDSGWNRIPVSGSNRRYKQNPENMLKVTEWINYCQGRGATLYHDLDDIQVNFINDLFTSLEECHRLGFKALTQLK